MGERNLGSSMFYGELEMSKIGGKMKRPRKVDIIYKEIITTISEYTCPFCNVTVEGAGIGKNITRFKCEECKNELIVDKFIFEKGLTSQ
jgi:transposase-like protein